ncbi:hypothetical protein [Mucilaginibacter aquaedulcis]|nr:hypothetical protein [Mucilaginibacter aquaedulcis]MDN3550940.1 hypothetical protein [Mucilaginibacter aquaedulcis]
MNSWFKIGDDLRGTYGAKPILDIFYKAIIPPEQSIRYHDL